MIQGARTIVHGADQTYSIGSSSILAVRLHRFANLSRNASPKHESRMKKRRSKKGENGGSPNRFPESLPFTSTAGNRPNSGAIRLLSTPRIGYKMGGDNKSWANQGFRPMFQLSSPVLEVISVDGTPGLRSRVIFRVWVWGNGVGEAGQ